jgi:formylglycine-generating enzyme required for sulfatase activity
MTSTTSAQPTADSSAPWRRYLSAGVFLQGRPSPRPGAPQVVKVNIPRSLRPLVANPASLELDGYLLALAAEGSGPGAMDRVGCLLEPHPAGMRALGADFHWGAVDCLFALEPLQTDLGTLLSDEASSAKQAAFQQVDQARKAFSAGRFSQSAALLAEVFGMEQANDFECWRAHFLDGLIRFGFAGGDPDLIDLGTAERRFAAAARLVKDAHPHVAAQALCMASYGTILADKLGRAHGYLEAAIGLDDELAEAHFLSSRVFLQQANKRGAFEAMMRALALDQGYAVRAGSVDATCADVGRLGSLLSALSRELRSRGQASIRETLKRLRLLAGHRPAHDDPDVLGLRAFVREDEDWPLYDVIRTLTQKDQLVEEIFQRYRAVRIISSVEQAGITVQVEGLRTLAAPKRNKAASAAQRLFKKDDGDTETREQRRMGSANLTIMSATIRDISQRILTEFDLVKIPDGVFTMGSLADESGRAGDEFPHEVRLTRPYYMGLMPVTQELWHAVMNNHPSYFDGHDRPIEQASWVDALVFCNELSQMSDLAPCYEIGHHSVKWLGPDVIGYRLPTEAEWERACRAGTQTITSVGHSVDPSQGNMARRHGPLTTPVGTYAPSDWGLLDTHGNIWEWCFDAYGDYGNAQGDDPCVVSQHDLRCARGGSWDSDLHECRAASRAHYSRWSRRNTVGFRLAMSVGTSES